MREGFFWNEDNVIPERSYIDNSHDHHMEGHDLHCKRVWTLVDLSPEHLWHTELTVWGPDIQTLARFRVSDLQTYIVYSAMVKAPREACNTHRRTIYLYDENRPERCINTIYDDLPLEGWWPWPKLPGQEDLYFIE
ncbi:hypothetical protein CPLU01_08137 [Colletotrichum plurivorum]|uniref:Uncharacterized protein n=1 Tax=Colletotrichum plurivorum TaxID=2175906 RepID=A0A8H6KCU5_9PEZI|nr:hypothetical protein CPLU01_08137 [Colletotrichum plurivorum]